MEFRSVLFVPGMGPLNNEDVVNPKTKNIRLYVKRVFISDDFDGELVSATCSFEICCCVSSLTPKFMGLQNCIGELNNIFLLSLDCSFHVT